MVSCREKRTLLTWKAAEWLFPLWFLLGNKLFAGKTHVSQQKLYVRQQSCAMVLAAKLPHKLFATEGKQGYQKSAESELSSEISFHLRSSLLPRIGGIVKKSPRKPAEVKPWWGAADTAGKSPWSLPSLPAPTAAPRASEDHWSKRKRRGKKSVETAGGWNAHRTQQAAIPASCFSSPWERAAEAAGKHALQNSLHLGTWHLRFSWRPAEAAVSLSAHVTPRPYGNHRAEQFQISLQPLQLSPAANEAFALRCWGI